MIRSWNLKKTIWHCPFSPNIVIESLPYLSKSMLGEKLIQGQVWFRIACLLCWEVAEFFFLHNSSYLDLLTFKAIFFPMSSGVLYEKISFQILFPIKFHILLWFKINLHWYCVILFFQVFEILSRWSSYDAYNAWRSAIYCSSLTD